MAPRAGRVQRAFPEDKPSTLTMKLGRLRSIGKREHHQSRASWAGADLVQIRPTATEKLPERAARGRNHVPSPFDVLRPD